MGWGIHRFLNAEIDLGRMPFLTQLQDRHYSDGTAFASFFLVLVGYLEDNSVSPVNLDARVGVREETRRPGGTPNNKGIEPRTFFFAVRGQC